MTRSAPVSVLENARIVHHDRVSLQSLAFVGGRVAHARPGAFRLDLRDHLIFPGLINAHDHLHLNCVPRLPHDQHFSNSYEWIDAFESYRRTPAVDVAVRVPSELRHWHGGLKNVLAGATTVAHHDPRHDAFADPNFPVNVPRNLGWSHSLRLGEPRDGGATRYGRYGPPVRDSFLTTPSTQPWVIHAAEGWDNIARTEIAALDELGCLAGNTVIVHGLGMGADDVDRVLARGASVVWCPRSNLELFGRTLDPRRLFVAGRLTLGTDSRLTGSRDLLDELRAAATHGDLSPAELLRLVTADASTVLRLSDCGHLERNARADCLIVRGQGDGDPYRVLIDATRADLRAVVRGAVPVVADPDFAEWFAACGVDATLVLLDGRPKLLARHLARADLGALERGLEICPIHDA